MIHCGAAEWILAFSGCRAARAPLAVCGKNSGARTLITALLLLIASIRGRPMCLETAATAVSP